MSVVNLQCPNCGCEGIQYTGSPRGCPVCGTIRKEIPMPVYTAKCLNCGYTEEQSFTNSCPKCEGRMVKIQFYESERNKLEHPELDEEDDDNEDEEASP